MSSGKTTCAPAVPPKGLAGRGRWFNALAGALALKGAPAAADAAAASTGGGAPAAPAAAPPPATIGAPTAAADSAPAAPAAAPAAPPAALAPGAAAPGAAGGERGRGAARVGRRRAGSPGASGASGDGADAGSEAPGAPDPLVEEQRRAQAKRLRAEAAAFNRKARVAAFLIENDFLKGVKGPKHTAFKLKTTYPLHAAAKSGHAPMVRMLLQEGANPAQVNSAGETAAQVAQKVNSHENSHFGVLCVLAAATPARRRAAAVGGA